MTPGQPIDFWLCGPLRMRRGDYAAPLRATLLHEVLALLLLRANSAVTIAEIVRSIWPGEGVNHEKIRPYIHRLRDLLAEAELDCRIETLTRRYVLWVDPARVDVLRFGRLVVEAERADVDARRRLVEEALELCPSDELLNGFTRAWVHAAREEYRAQWRNAVLLRNQSLLDAGEHERLLAVLQRERAHQSTDQRIVADYLLALYRSGQEVQAREHARRLIEHLVASGKPVQPRLSRIVEAIEHRAGWLNRGPSRFEPAPIDLLPPPTGGLEGRQSEIRTMQDHAAKRDGVRVIGLYGAPGIGKTTLATAFAHRVKANYPGGVLFARLRFDADPADIDAVLESFLRTLGVSPDSIPVGREARVAQYRDLTRRRTMLVVLDNVRSSEDAATLLPTGPGSLAIVTSRERLTALTARHGALALVLGPIEPTASVAVLRRLAGHRADWNPEVAADIAAACSGHPLALCLAGARLATRPEEPLEAVAEALAQPGRRLGVLDRYAEAEEAATDVIAWSYRTLAEPTARLFRLMGLSPCAALDRPSVARLADIDDDEAARLLAELAASHLVTTDHPASGPGGALRYGMLDLIAEYAAARAAEVDTEAARTAALDRLYGYLTAVARAAAHALWPSEVPEPDGRDRAPVFAGPEPARAWLDEHRDDLLVVATGLQRAGRPRPLLDLANSLYRYLDHGGYLDQAAAIQQMAIDAARAVSDHGELAIALVRLGGVLVRRGQAERAETVLTEALELSTRDGNLRGQAMAAGNLGRVAYRRGAYDAALAYQLTALDRFRAAGYDVGVARTLTNLAIVRKARGELNEALHDLDEAREICQRCQAFEAAARVAGTAAGIHRMQGKLAEADAQYRTAIDLFRSFGDRLGEATALSHLGLVRSDQGHHAQAIELHEEALRIFTAVGDEGGTIDTLLSLGTALRSAGRYVSAMRCHQEALERAASVGDQGQVARAHGELAMDQAAQATRPDVDALAAYSAARKHLSESLNAFHELGIAPPAEVTALAAQLD
jgi:tetratricopeptide (TPR) repeat protein